MKLLIKQRVFSWSDTYDVYDEWGVARYYVRAEFLSLGHQIHVYEKRTGREIGVIRQRLLTLLPTFDIEIEGRTVGTVKKEFTFLFPRYDVDYLGWKAEGDFFAWDYQVTCGNDLVMTISKELLTWGDTYTLDYPDPGDEIPGLLLAIAIDAANCSGKE